MSRIPVFMNAFDRIINISEVLTVTEVGPFPSMNTPAFLRVDFIEKGYLELFEVTKDEFWEALGQASLTLQENRRSTGSNERGAQ